MGRRRVIIGFALALCAAIGARAAVFDVKSFGAKADGSTADREAINKAIEAGAAAGGGTVYFPAGTYLTGSIRLLSNITLELAAGATLLSSSDPKAYDAPEPNQWTQYQDFGHSHWRNSLIWGEGLTQHRYRGAWADRRPGTIAGGRGPGAGTRPSR